MIDDNPEITRFKLSKMVCTALNWLRIDGKPKDMSCRVALLKMEADQLFKLPPAKRGKPVRKANDTALEEAIRWPDNVQDFELKDVEINIVKGLKQSRLWNSYIDKYHYLGFALIPGAQLRYLVKANEQIVALLSFGASAWKVMPRDTYIGWTKEQREKNLHLIINNSRFLILPWITKKNLASKVLSLISKRISDDWYKTYSYRPVLLETFVEDQRFLGTCYKASNWQCLGKTQGRGKLDTHKKKEKPIKTIWVLPIDKKFRKKLTDEKIGNQSVN
jgi:hypothetical protein